MSDPLTRLVELTVYAPIGLAAVARERLPDYVEEGRTRVEQRLTLARFIGQMVVTQGRRELERRVRAAAEPPPPRLRVVPDVSPPAAEPAPEPDTDEPAPDADDLPIEAYESLAAAQVVARLADLDDIGLARVEHFERAHRNRRTVLNRIDQLRSST